MTEEEPTAGIDVERVDFVSVLTQDIPRAREFYADGNKLMLHRRYAPR